MNPKDEEELDFCFVGTPGSLTAANKVVEITCNTLPEQYGADVDNIQVLSPTKKINLRSKKLFKKIGLEGLADKVGLSK